MVDKLLKIGEFLKLKLLLILLAVLIAGFGIGLVMPNYYYHQIVTKGKSYELFKLNHFKAKLAKPGELIEEEESRVENPELWRKFQIKDVLIPLPVHHPLYLTSPILNYNDQGRAPEIGIRILKPDGRELAKILFLNSSFLNPKLDTQELFKIPIFKTRLAKINRFKLWQDLFTKDLTNPEISYKEIAYNLFLLDLRHRFLPAKTLNFHLAKNKKFALVELKSDNLDYRTELILSYTGGQLLSYLIVTDKQTEGALELRNYFLHNISMQPGSSHLSEIIFKEYSALDFKERVDLEGLTYLFSAWSHDTGNKDYIRSMIENLERGSKFSNFDEQLKELYIYAAKAYKTTFSEIKVDVKGLPDEVMLLRNLELEKKEDYRKERVRVVPPIKKKKKAPSKSSFLNKLDRAKKMKTKGYPKAKID